MASGKLSPRQKMINMMYLVLLALLAMNVSAEILNAFEIISKKLQTTALEASDNSKEFMNAMKAKIDEEIKNEGKMKNAKLKDTLDDVKTRTDAMIALLDKHILALRDSISGVDEKTGQLLKRDDTEGNHQYWIGRGADDANDGRGNAMAYSLHQALDKYVEYLVNMYNSQVDPAKPELRIKMEEEKLTADPSEEVTQDGVKKTWERYTFEGPLVANVAMLQSFKTDVYEKEKRLLDLFNSRLGVATFKADKVIAIDAPTATIVPAGLPFQTRLFVAMSSSQIQPRFSSAGGSIKQEPGASMATLTLNASGNVIPQGKTEGTQGYTASIQVPKATGGFETLEVKGQFTVRKPEIQVTSAAIQILYRACANDVNIDVPALGDYYNPVITADNAEVIKSTESKKRFRLVPGSGRTCKVGVSSLTNGATVKIGDVDYKVIEPPKPGLNMAVNGKPYNGSQMVNRNSPIAVRVEPDPDFKANLPQDARYRISAIKVLAQLSLGPPTPINTINTAGQDATSPIRVALGSQIRDARPGTKVYIQLAEIQRVNFQNKTINDNRFTEVEKTLSLVVE
jgi:gliding motility-associated protein GldM